MPARPLDAEVDALLGSCPPARRADVDRLRALVLGVDDSIVEGVKWKSPSFRTAEWFATLNLSAKDHVRVILHAGAKARGLDLVAAIPDPDGLLEWLGPERAMVRLDGPQAIDRHGAALAAIVRAWIARV